MPARERTRLWYVATTRARDLLVLPRHSASLKDASWAKAVDLDLPALPAFDVAQLPNTPLKLPAEPDNQQTGVTFSEEAKRIVASEKQITWLRPSRSEVEMPEQAREIPIYMDAGKLDETAAIEPVRVTGSATRGTILHKLMEEVLAGETNDDKTSLTNRAAELLSQLRIKLTAEPSERIAPSEIGETITRTLNLPEIINIRDRLLPERTIYAGQIVGNDEILVSGIADTVVLGDDGNVEMVIDWKSDIKSDGGFRG